MTVMRKLLSARGQPAALLALALLLAQAQTSYGQPAPSDNIWGTGPWAPVSSSRFEVQVQQVPQAFMPLVVASPEVEIQFGTGVDSQQNLVNPGTVFAYGIAR